MKYLLEVCAFNIRSCQIAEKAGAWRVELCDNPIEGGTTPSYGTICQVREKVNIDLYPIIRPRAGHYFYDEEEFSIMKKDIRVCRETACDGISVGVQLFDGRIDRERMKKIIEWAYPMGVTCNRVFDATPNAFEALETLIECGCERVLTSGQKSAAPDAVDLLGKLHEAAAGRISIMPGAGVRSSNLEKLILGTGACEYHTSARVPFIAGIGYANPAVLDTGQMVIADEQELIRMLVILDKFNSEEEKQISY